MASSSKTQLINDVYAVLKKRYKLEPQASRFSVLEAVVYGICHEGTTREQADQVLSRFKDQFFDWNEVRVSALPEIEGALSGLTDSQGRARRIRKFLRQLFERTYGFSLDTLLRKPQKEAVKSLKEYEAFQSDYVLSTVVQQALGGHAIPIDEALRRVLLRLHVAEEGGSDESLQNLLERAIPKNRGAEFFDLIQELAQETCLEFEPACSRCELRKLCPTGKERLSPASKKRSKLKATATQTAVSAEKPVTEKSTSGKKSSEKAKADSAKKISALKDSLLAAQKEKNARPKSKPAAKAAEPASKPTSKAGKGASTSPKNAAPPAPKQKPATVKDTAPPAKKAAQESKEKRRRPKGR